MTFTERAAREMRDRIRKSVRDKLLRAPTEGEADLWLAILRRLEGRRSARFTRFAATLLRRHAVEVGPRSAIRTAGAERGADDRVGTDRRRVAAAIGGRGRHADGPGDRLRPGVRARCRDVFSRTALSDRLRRVERQRRPTSWPRLGSHYHRTVGAARRHRVGEVVAGVGDRAAVDLRIAAAACSSSDAVRRTAGSGRAIEDRGP